MSLIISVSTNEINTMIRIVEKFLVELRSKNQKLPSNETEKKTRNKQLDEFIYATINETIAKNNTHRLKNPNADLNDLFDMEFSENSVRLYKDSITAFLDEVKNTDVKDLSQHIAHSERLLEAFDNSIGS